MDCSTANAFDLFCRLDRDGKLDEVPKIKKQKVATEVLLDKLHEQDFAGLLSLRASKVLGPNSRYRVADILPHMKLVSRASRLGLAVGILRILCNGLCTALRFHTEEHDHTCRVGCPQANLTLSHINYNECPRLYTYLLLSGDTLQYFHRDHFLHDLITRVFLRSLQYGIVVGFLDAFVHAHHQHRRGITLVIA